ncbi:MAG: DUF3078 domain-containing protein [Prevotella sp.]|jgi:hypothetical protein
MSVHRIFISLLMLLAVLAPKAQSRHAHQHYNLLLRHYEERLRNYRDSLYADSVKAPTILSTEEMAPLFMPMTFYKDVAHNAFTLGRQLSPLDERLLNIYLNRPDQVVRTETQLEEAGPVIAPKTMTQTPKAIMEQTKPDEPDIVPVDMIVLKPNFWTYGGEGYLQFLQNYVSQNWYQGGEGNYSMVGAITLQANYNNKQKVKWENKLEVKLGLQTTRSDTLHKLKTSEDLLRYTGKLGLQATKKWYYTLQAVAYTQMMRTYDKNQSPVKSDFMSPFNLNISLGMDYNVSWLDKHLTGSIHLAPLAYNFKYVGRLSLATNNGIDEGHHSKNDIGSQMTMDLKWKFSDNILWQTRFAAYTTYKRTEMEWENTFTFQFNQFISAKLFLYPRFDDSVERDEHHGYFQFKEYTSLGFAYSF